MMMEGVKGLFTEEVPHETKCPMRHFVSWGTFVTKILFVNYLLR